MSGNVLWWAVLKIVLKSLSTYHPSIYLSIEIGQKSMKRQLTEEETGKVSKHTKDSQFH